VHENAFPLPLARPDWPRKPRLKWSMKALKLIFALHNHTNHTDNSAS
jgi:hypothetical protein